MGVDLEHTLMGQRLVLQADGALFWREEKTLVVADAHLGKARTFRDEGIPVPPGTTAADLERLTRLLDRFDVKRLLFLGDLIHGPIDDAQAFERQIVSWRDRHWGVHLLLTTGNHDRRAGRLTEVFGLDGLAKRWVIEPFAFTHRPQTDDARYGFAGHIHPAVRLTGRGRQRESLPCFCFGPQKALLPAFGCFTGNQIVRPSPNDRVFVITEDTVVDIPPVSPIGRID